LIGTWTASTGPELAATFFSHFVTTIRLMAAARLPILGCLEQYGTATIAALVFECDVAANGGVTPMPKQTSVFIPKTFLSTAGAGREMMSVRKGQVIFAQGDASDAVFVIQTGRVRLSRRSRGGKEVTLYILGAEDFIGKDAIAGKPARTASASALTPCQILRIEKNAMMMALEHEVTLANAFSAYVLTRNLRYQEDMVEQRCDQSEMRLASVLLRLASLESDGPRETTMQKINQGTLAEMVGTTRSRVSFFMNRFKDSGYIDYGSKSEVVRVRHSLMDFYTQ
jgi:CRP-like cAMP-binding protein